MKNERVKEISDVDTDENIDPSKSDSQSLSYEQLQSYFTADESEQDRMCDENPMFCNQCLVQYQPYVEEWTKRSIKKRLDDQGDLYTGDKEELLSYIHMRLGDDISDEVREELTDIAEIIMSDSEQYQRERTAMREAGSRLCNIRLSSLTVDKDIEI